MNTLLKCTKLADGAVVVGVAGSSLQRLGTRGVIYNVPLDIFAEDILACLASQGVQSVKRFSFKRKDSPELQVSKSVFLQFNTADLPAEVKLGYLFFRVKQYIPRPLRCHKCNRYGHVATHCRGKLRCSIRGAELLYISIASAALLLRNVPTEEALTPRLKNSARDANGKLKYLTFPSLPKSTVDRSHATPFLTATPLPHATDVPLDQDEFVVTEQIDFSSFLFGNPVIFLAFLAEVIKQTILAKDKNENIDVC